MGSTRFPSRAVRHGGLLLFSIGLVLSIGSRPLVAQITVSQLLARSVEDPSEPQYEDVRTAIEQFYGGQVAAARDTLTKVTSARAELPPAGILLSQLLFATNQIATARGELESVVREHPDDPEAYLLFGELALGGGRLTEAEALFLRGRDLNAKYQGSDLRKKNLDTSAWAGLAMVASQRQQWDKAEEFVRRWLSLAPSSAPAHAQLGQVLFFSQRPREAYQAFQTAHRLDAKLLQPEVRMGVLYQQLVSQGDDSQQATAARFMQLAASKAANDLSTRLAVARWALDACQIDVAQSNAQAALRLDPSSFEALLLVGLAARHRKDPATAERAFRDAHLQSPANYAVLAQLALVLSNQQDPAKQKLALDYAELNFRAHADPSEPAGSEAATVLAWILFQLGRNADALATVQAAISSNQPGGENAYLAARILSANGLDHSAISLLEAALTNPTCFPDREQAEELLAKLVGK